MLLRQALRAVGHISTKEVLSALFPDAHAIIQQLAKILAQGFCFDQEFGLAIAEDGLPDVAVHHGGDFDGSAGPENPLLGLHLQSPSLGRRPFPQLHAIEAYRVDDKRVLGECFLAGLVALGASADMRDLRQGGMGETVVCKGSRRDTAVNRHCRVRKACLAGGGVDRLENKRALSQGGWTDDLVRGPVLVDGLQSHLHQRVVVVLAFLSIPPGAKGSTRHDLLPTSGKNLSDSEAGAWDIYAREIVRIKTRAGASPRRGYNAVCAGG